MLQVLQHQDHHARLTRSGRSGRWPYSSSLARRARHALRRPTWKFGDLFTACYSGIFATALLIDAKRKESRVEQWNKAIATIEEECSVKEARHKADLGVIPERFGLKDNFRPFTWNGPPLTSRRGVLRNVGGRFLDSGLQFSERNIPLETSFDPPTEWQCRALERSISCLVVRMMLKTSKILRDHASSEKASELVPPEAMQSLDGLIRDLQDTNNNLIAIRFAKVPFDKYVPERPCYQSSLSIDYRLEGRNRHQRLRSAFAVYRKQSLNFEFLIAHICHVLLTDRSPPNVDTFNLLILQLTSLRLFTFVRIVLNSFFECRIFGNEVTITAIIKYFTASKDVTGFRFFLQKMRGLHGGLGSATRQTRLLKQDPRALVQPDLMFSEDWRVLKSAPFTRAVFGAILRGCLEFGFVDEASQWAQWMEYSEIPPDLPILTSVLRACVDRRDWFTGLSLWQSMLSFRLDGYAFHCMLSLCRACGKEVEFQNIYNLALSFGFEEGDAPAAQSSGDGPVRGFSIINGNRSLKLTVTKRYTIAPTLPKGHLSHTVSTRSFRSVKGPSDAPDDLYADSSTQAMPARMAG